MNRMDSMNNNPQPGALRVWVMTDYTGEDAIEYHSVASVPEAIALIARLDTQLSDLAWYRLGLEERCFFDECPEWMDWCTTYGPGGVDIETVITVLNFLGIDLATLKRENV